MFMRRNKYIVYTDSKSAIDALKALSISSHPLVTKCAELSNHLIEKGINIAFWCIPRHCGIKGNERADHAAKTAFLMKENFVQLVDAQRAAQNLIIGSWKDIWEQETSSKLHEFHPCLKPLKLAGLNRRKEVVLSRLRIGHTRCTHKYLLCSEPPPACRQCQSLLTVKHILIECPSFNEYRLNRFGGINMNLKKLLRDNPHRNLFLFLADIRAVFGIPVSPKQPLVIGQLGLHQLAGRKPAEGR
ncbi:hypothetical protein AVEN_217133-1 [Araneus ventricosus]|uniref:RNase H type-1 domain-containing protein n=1 Tax=Araneus ventricosus TaxID=182803 RepID=A0A4Y2E966_ARAVE|nr:hypothetical protein AVEN_217133-1 [Araneus ventricosus]